MNGNAKAINPINPNTGKSPLYYITREDEWYKAAFYNAQSKTYYRFATQSNDNPGNLVGSKTNQANYINPQGLMCTTQSPDLLTTVNYLTDVGAFTGSASYYGTFEQNGNVWEWNDIPELVGYRILRGGGWTSYAGYMESTYRLGNPLTTSGNNGGFRIASPVGDSIVFPNPSPPSPPLPAPPTPPPAPTPPPTPSSDQIKVELVKVGDINNPADPLVLQGSVAYEYQIGKYLVTIDQYTTFLNAVASVNDTYSLWNEKMSTDMVVAGISRQGSQGSYKYSVMSNNGSSANRPITYVSAFDAARFANWMSNGQPKGSQSTATTENGAYPLYGVVTGIFPAQNSLNPNTGKAPTYYIPSESEWYKSGFYGPALNGGSGGYFVYATQNSTLPGNNVGSLPNQANFIYSNGYYSVPQSPTYDISTNYLSDVGAFSSSPSYYNTFDQNGNVWEWNNVDGKPSSSRGQRGGFYAGGPASLSPTTFSYVSAAREEADAGFRLAAPVAAPEPSPSPSPAPVNSPPTKPPQTMCKWNGLYQIESLSCPGKFIAFSVDNCTNNAVLLRTENQSKPPRTHWNLDAVATLGSSTAAPSAVIADRCPGSNGFANLASLSDKPSPRLAGSNWNVAITPVKLLGSTTCTGLPVNIKAVAGAFKGKVLGYGDCSKTDAFTWTSEASIRSQWKLIEV
jgi:sulfatase modifying factor 1